MNKPNNTPKTSGFEAMAQVIRGVAVSEAIGKAASEAGIMLPRDVKMPFSLNPAEERDIVPPVGVNAPFSSEDIAVAAARSNGVIHDTDPESSKARTFRSVVADRVNVVGAGEIGVPSNELVSKGRELGAMQEQLVQDGGVSSSERSISSTVGKLEKLKAAGVELPAELTKSVETMIAA